MVDTPINFSFAKFFNQRKGVFKAEKNFELDYLEKRAPEFQKKNFSRLFKWIKDNGIEFNNVQYPVYFGEGESKYPGIIALEDLKPHTTIVKVPSKCIISSRACYYSDLKHIFDAHPDVFGYNLTDGEDNIMYSFVLYQLGLGEKSFWHPVFQTWPTSSETDILVTWDMEDIEMLHDETCQEDINKNYQDYL
jgi:hypothetical protein